MPDIVNSSNSKKRRRQMTEEQLRKFLNRRHERPGDVFMDVLKREGCFIAPGVYGGQGAKNVRKIYHRRKAQGNPCTYNGVYGSGWAISAILWALPDMGFHDLTEFSMIVKYIVANAHPLPVIMDAETGFGTDVTLAAKTVETYHRLGVAVAHLEDQGGTRRCGNLGGKVCVEPEEMIAKIRSWLTATRALDSSMRLMVRTDALTAMGGGLENAIERGKRYMDVEVGGLRPAMLWADAMMDPEVIDKWVEAMHAHDPEMVLAINYSPNKDWSGIYPRKYNRNPPTYQELYREGKGFRVIFHTILEARAAFESGWDVFEDMAENGAEALWKLHERQRNHPVGDSQAMAEFSDWQEYEKHIEGEAAAERYEKSEGYKGGKK